MCGPLDINNLRDQLSSCILSVLRTEIFHLTDCLFYFNAYLEYITFKTGFILNLETWKTWKIGHFYKKSMKTWNSQGIFIIFIQVRENSGESQGKQSISSTYHFH